MKKFILLSLLIHLIASYSLFYINSKKEINNVNAQESHSLGNTSNIEKNITREEVMNAIAVSEEDLQFEVDRIIKIEALKKELFEEKLNEIKKTSNVEKEKLEQMTYEQIKLIESKKDTLKHEIDSLKELRNKIKEDKQILSEKENKILQEKNKIITEKSETLKILDYVNSKKENDEKVLQEKQKHIQEQSEYIRKQEEEIEILKKKLKTKQTAVTNKKKESNFLKNLSIAEREKIKLDIANHNLIIKNKIYKYWNLPNNTIRKTDCIIDLTQSNSGIVLAIKFVSCINNEEIKDSIRKAVLDASPLPLPENKNLFDKHIQLYFTVN